MSENPGRLYSFEEWVALTPEERREVRRERRAAVDRARAEHNARRRLNDALTVERFGPPLCPDCRGGDVHDHGADR
jgi:hypothetical protein